MSVENPRALPWTVPATALALAAALGIARWAFAPPAARDLPFGAFILGMVWLYIEAAMARGDSDRSQARAIHRWHRTVFAALGLYAACWNGLALAADLDMLGSTWLPTARRGMGIAAGAMLAIWGNYLPKLLSPWRLDDEPFDWQGVHRVVGWLASLGGVGIVIAWTILPIDPAGAVARWVFACVFIVALSVKFLSLATHSPATGRR